MQVYTKILLIGRPVTSDTWGTWPAVDGGCPIFLHLESGACAVLARSFRELARAVWLKMVFGQSHHADTLRWLILL